MKDNFLTFLSAIIGSVLISYGTNNIFIGMGVFFAICSINANTEIRTKK